MDHIHGTCSLCGGRVTTPAAWYGLNPPVPSCQACGATKANPYGGIVPMEDSRKPRQIPDGDGVTSGIGTGSGD